MIGVQRERLASWCNHNADLLVIACGALTLAYVETLATVTNPYPNIDLGFWGLFFGVVMLSIGISALVCYRVILRLHGSFGM